jgi:hypothetical protein
MRRKEVKKMAEISELTAFYDGLEILIHEIAKSHKEGLEGDMDDPEDREKAISYIQSFEEKTIDRLKSYIRAYRDFK